MVTGGPRPAMQRVGLDEDDAALDDGVPSGVERLGARLARLRGWAVRRPARTAAAAAMALVLLVTAVVGGPHWVSEHERDRVLADARFPGALRGLDAPPRPRWWVPVDGSVAPVLVGDVVVAVTGAPGAGRRLVGIDVVAGGRSWSVPLDGPPVAQTVLCRGLDGRLACAVGPVPPSDRRLAERRTVREAGASTLLLIDPADGTVLVRRDIDGWVVATDRAGPDLVVATYAWGMLTVRRLDASTGDEQWETERWTRLRWGGSSRVTLVAAGGLVTASGNEVTLLLDAETGERLPRPEGSSVSDETRLLDDGTLVRTRYRVRRASVGAVSELSTGRGDPWFTVRGSLVEPGISDGSSGLVFTAIGLSGGPLGGRVRAYRTGSRAPVWRARTPATDVAVDAAGRVVLRGPGTLVGLDAASGEPVWRQTFDGPVGATFTDGEHVVVEHESVEGIGSVTALSLEDGRSVWEFRLPADAPRLTQIGTHLYALGDGLLVALR